MKQLDMADLRREWEPLSTAQLEAMLQNELEHRPPDDEKVILLLHILEDREPKLPLQLTAREEEAWEKYRQKAMSRKGKAKLPMRWLSVAASVVLVITMVTAVMPQKAEAEGFWEMLQRITHSIMEYISPRERLFDAESEYVFLTDNPGLQQVYDAVVELGVTEPVVPMWLPEHFEIQAITKKNTPMSQGIWVTFSDSNNEIVYKLDVYDGEPAHQYYRDDLHYENYEWDGTVYDLTQNNGWWTVVWTKENIECHLTLVCQEETLQRILRSIYVMEAN